MANQSAPGRQDSISPLLLGAYLSGAFALLLALVVYRFSADGNLAGLVPLAVMAAVFCVVNPRWALYQYVFCVFIVVRIHPEMSIYLGDLSALVVIGAAVLDVLSTNYLPRRLPRLSMNFLLLLLALLVAAAFGYDPGLSWRPVMKIGLLLATFASLYRLAAKSDPAVLVKLFFWICCAHAIAIVIPIAAAAGARSFGISGSAFDDLAMVALPIGVAILLWEPTGRSAKYLVGCAAVLGGLVATQSRASLGFAVIASVLVLILSIRRARQVRSGTYVLQDAPGLVEVTATVKTRAVVVILAVVVMIGGAAALLPDLSSHIAWRFESVLTATPTGTVRTRLELWKAAWMAFSRHPLLGVGPGTFTVLYHIFPTLHMQPLHFYTHGLSAHSLFLHYLAESGMLGAGALVALFLNLFRHSRGIWRCERRPTALGVALALFSCGLVFLVTMFLEAGWMWGQSGYPFVLFAALIVRYYRQLSDQ